MKGLGIALFILFSSLGSIVTAQNDKARTDRFNTIDADGNEVITIREMRTYYKDKRSKEGELMDHKKMFYALDANENSIITLNEFLKGEDWKLAYKYVDKWQYKVPETVEEEQENTKKDKVREKFENIDSDRNDTLFIQEVVNFYKGKVNNKTGKPINGKLNFYTYDVNNDGNITLDEFAKKPNWKKGHDRLTAAENKGKPVNSDEPSEGYVKKRIEIFGVVDANDDYKITFLELKEYYKDKLNKQGKPVNALFQFFGLDKNEDDSIELAEFASKIDMDLARRKYKASNGNKK